MIRFIGANPGLTVREGQDRVAFASVWRADWSERGRGRAIVLWHEGRTRVVATDADLGRWLAQEFTRHFPEVRGLPWPDPQVEVGEVELNLDLERGLLATAAEITVGIGPPTDRRLFQTDEFDLGGVRHHLSTVFMPSASGSLELRRVPVKGSVTAFLADAEVWSRPAGGP